MKKNKFKRIISIFFIFIVLIIIFQKPINILAEDIFITDPKMGDFYDKNQSWLVSNDFLTDALRTIGWFIIKLLKMLVEACQKLYENSIGLLDFTNYGKVNDLIEKYKLAYTSIMTLSLIYLGYSFIISKDKKTNVFKSLFLSVFCFSALIGVMCKVNTAVEAFAIDTACDNSITTSIISNQTFDLLSGIDKQKLDFDITNTDSTKEAKISADSIELIKINEVINYNDTSLAKDVAPLFFVRLAEKKKASDMADELVAFLDNLAKELETSPSISTLIQSLYILNEKDSLDEYIESLKNLDDDTVIYRLVPLDKGLTLPFVDSGKNGFMNEFYYRYHIEYFPIIITLIAFAIVYIAMSYKTIRCIYELTVKRILALLYSADINGTQKTLKILSSIKDGYIVIILSSILIKLFLYMYLYIVAQNFNTLTKSLLLIMAALVVVDGPDIIQQLTGIDAGLSGGVGKMMAAYHIGKGVARTASSLPRGLARMAGNSARDHRLASSIGKAHENKRAIDNASSQDLHNSQNIPKDKQDNNNLNGNNVKNGPNQAKTNNSQNGNLPGINSQNHDTTQGINPQNNDTSQGIDLLNELSNNNDAAQENINGLDYSSSAIPGISNESNDLNNLNQRHYNSNNIEEMSNEVMLNQSSNLGAATSISPSSGTYNLNGQLHRHDGNNTSRNIEESLMRNDNLFGNHN